MYAAWLHGIRGQVSDTLAARKRPLTRPTLTSRKHRPRSAAIVARSPAFGVRGSCLSRATEPEGSLDHWVLRFLAASAADLRGGGPRYVCFALCRGRLQPGSSKTRKAAALKGAATKTDANRWLVVPARCSSGVRTPHDHTHRKNPEVCTTRNEVIRRARGASIRPLGAGGHRGSALTRHGALRPRLSRSPTSPQSCTLR